MDKCKKILSQILFYGALLLIVAASLLFFLQKKSGQTLFLFDRTLLWVETASMQPTIPEKSYILAKSTSTEAAQVGDVIVFVCRDTGSAVYGSYITHRITEQTPEGYKTCGDSPLSLPDPWTVQPEDIVAVYEKNLPLMTALGRLFSTPMGMVLVFALFFAVCGFVFIPTVVKTLQEQDENTLTEEEFHRLVAREVRRLEEQGLTPEENRENEEGGAADE